MGLDNSIEIRRNEKSMSIYNKLKRFEDDWDKEHKYDFEVLYYRKCYNVRNLILRCLGAGEEDYEIPVKREDIPNIIAALKSLNKKNWEDCGSSIWDWEDQEPYIKRHIKNLKYLYKLMGKHDLDVYFYDSY